MPSSLSESALGSYFKPEVRKQGSDLEADGSVTLSQASDTQIQAYIKASSMIRVSLTSASISDPLFTVRCSCPRGSKGAFCKHVWATLLKVAQSYPDFLTNKGTIEIGSQRESASSLQKVALKEKQSAYRKSQYQQQKLRTKAARADTRASGSKFQAALPDTVTIGLSYFAENGFPLEMPLDPAALGNAKKLLARVFHPDKGGTHDEMLELNRHFDALHSFSRTGL